MPLSFLLTLAAPQQFALDGAPRLERVAVIQTAAPGAEIVALQAGTGRLALTHSATGQVELFDLADPAAPRTLRTIDLGLAPGEELTSVALPPSGDWCLATVKARGVRAPGRALAHGLADGRRLAEFACGVGPDSVTIASDGSLALIANEAEGFELGGSEGGTEALVSAPGSLTLVRFEPDLARSSVLQIPFPQAVDAPTDGRELEREVGGHRRSIALGTGPEFLEPEMAVILPGARRALVTLQENNLVAYVDLAAARIERCVPLGTASHPADLIFDGRFDERGVLTARREPDGLALTPDGRYFLTADEGDSAPDVGETAAGRPAGGSRTLSVFELESGRLVGDTGPELDRLAAAADLYPDKRSPKRGCEPEMVVAFELAGVPYAAVTLERAGAVALVDLRDPAHPAAVSIAKSGKNHLKDEPEGLVLHRDREGQVDYLFVANEGTGTLGVMRLSPAAPSPGPR